jgi:predicted nucleic acid-binding protein
MKRIFLDTNVLVDVLTRREPFYAASAEVWNLCESRSVHGTISVISFNNIFYVARKSHGSEHALQMLKLLLDIYEPVSLDTQAVRRAIGAGFTDFEDAIQYHAAMSSAAECLVTRNAVHFPKSTLPVLAPEEFLVAYEAQRKADS